MALGMVEQADGKFSWLQRRSRYHSWLKKAKNRVERRKAKRNPECQHGYRRYNGWEI